MKSPKWLDRILYPFAHHTFQAAQGKLHYIDEGAGDPIVFVHGTPTWSFLWRQQIKSLSRTYRCIAPDHLGFGLSDKPAATEFSFTPEEHARNLEQLLEHLDLRNMTLVVHDFGGAIGLSYALRHPERVKKLVIMNTWMWNLEEEKRIISISKFMSGKVGKFLYTRLAFSPRILLPLGYHQGKHLTRDVKQHYLSPLPSSTARLATWHFAVALKESGAWFAQLWEQREKLRSMDKLILWGEKDKLLPLRILNKWEEAFPEARVQRIRAGHFLQEEKGSEVTEAIRSFIQEKQG